MKWSTKLKDTIVYWELTGLDQENAPTFASPVEIRGRWEDRKMEVTTTEQRTITISSQVMSDSEIGEGGYLYLGELSDLPVSNSNPRSLGTERAYEVKKTEFGPTLSRKQVVYLAYIA